MILFAECYNVKIVIAIYEIYLVISGHLITIYIPCYNEYFIYL